MATRKKKEVSNKRPVFKVTRTEEPEENDLKKVKAKIKKELEESNAKEREWYDKELEKNLKTP